MMTREEVVKWMEEAIQDTNTYWDSCSEALQKELNEQREVFLLAIDALLHADRKQKLEAENMKLKERIINWRKYTVPTREQVEKAWRGECDCTKAKACCTCCSMRCQYCIGQAEYKQSSFCMKCGRPLTDEAVQMVMERLEGMRNDKND